MSNIQFDEGEMKEIFIYFDATITGDDVLGRYEHHMTIGEDVFSDDVHFETIDIGPIGDMFVVETIGMKTSHMNGEIIG